MREVIVLPRAQRQIERAVKSWYRNRDKAPSAFIDDLAETLDLIAHNAGSGVRHVSNTSPTVRPSEK